MSHFLQGCDFTDDGIVELINIGWKSGNKYAQRKYRPRAATDFSTNDWITCYIDFFITNFLPDARNFLNRQTSLLKTPSAEQELESKCSVMRGSVSSFAAQIQLAKTVLLRVEDQLGIFQALKAASAQLPILYAREEARKASLPPELHYLQGDEAALKLLQFKTAAYRAGIKDFKDRCTEISGPLLFLTMVQRRELPSFMTDKIIQARTGPMHIVADIGHIGLMLKEFMGWPLNEEYFYKAPREQEMVSRLQEQTLPRQLQQQQQQQQQALGRPKLTGYAALDLRCPLPGS